MASSKNDEIKIKKAKKAFADCKKVFIDYV